MAMNFANVLVSRSVMTGHALPAEQIDRAETSYTFAAADARMASRAWRGRARMLSIAGNGRAALAAYTHAAHSSGADPAAFFDYGLALLDAGDRAGAISALRRVPDSEAFFLRRGASAYTQSVTAAMTQYRMAVEIRPESAIVQETWGQAQVYGAHDFAGGIASYRRARTLGMTHSYLAVEIGHAQAMAGDYDDALATLAGSDHLLAHAIRGDIFLKRARIPDAIREYARAVVELQSRDPWILVGYGSALCAAGRAADAEARWRQALEVAPGFAAVGAGRCVVNK
jgi:tetratricopeptide (TPR) repeat protein